MELGPIQRKYAQKARPMDEPSHSNIFSKVDLVADDPYEASLSLFSETSRASIGKSRFPSRRFVSYTNALTCSITVVLGSPP
jgi:hypothetical protein